MARKQQVTVRADLTGYVLRGQPVEGFADRPDLPLADRVAIALMAQDYAPGTLSEEQWRLLAREDARPRRPSALVRAFTENTLEDEETYKAGLYAQLSSQERAAIAGAEFPMTVGELAHLVDATPKQIRDWSDRKLIPTHRAGGARRYFSAAAARAAVLKRLSKQEIGILAALARRSRRTETLISILGTALASLASQVRRPQAQQDLANAGTLLQHAAVEMRRAS